MRSRILAFGLGVVIPLLAGCSGSSLPQAAEPTVGGPTASRGIPVTRTTDPSSVGLWVSSPSINEIFGLSRGGQRTIARIDALANGCYGPTGVKVDREQNLFVACNGDYSCQYQAGGCVGLIQAYAPGSASPSVAYQNYRSERCGRHNSCWSYATANDVAFDSRGHVFAANLTVTSCFANNEIIGCGTAGGGYSWWSVGQSQSAHIKIPNVYDEYFYYLDTDEAGDLYIDGAADFGTGQAQVFEITKPTRASWVMTALTPLTNDRLGGIYVSNAGAVLNVVDETARTISQYALPWVVSEKPFNILGPTLQQMGKGQPISGGFDRNEKHVAVGDGDGWIDLGLTADNRWTTAGKKTLASGAFGAAYVPSDK